MSNIALISPNALPQTETFILAHKNYLAGNVFFFHNGFVPTELAGKGKIMANLYQKAYYFLYALWKRKLHPRQYALADAFLKAQIDTVMVEYGDVAPYILPICEYLKLPLVVHFHGYDAYLDSILAKNETHYPKVFKYAHHIIVVSQAMKAQLISLGCPSEKITVNPCGPETLFAALKPTFTQKNYIAVGRFVPKKAPHLTIKAFYQVLQKHQDAHLWLAGKGELQQICMDLIRELGIEKKVTLVGAVSPDTIRRQMEKSFCFVQHSICSEDGDSEGTPVAILEAGAAGLPVVATHHAGIPDVVIEGETGFLVAEKAVDAMAAAMIRLADDMNLAQKMGENARKHILRNFSITQHIENMNKILASCTTK